jgi:hypothetical protein
MSPAPEARATSMALAAARVAASHVPSDLPLASPSGLPGETVQRSGDEASPPILPPAESSSATVITFPGAEETIGEVTAAAPVQRAADAAPQAAAPATDASGTSGGGSTPPADLDALAERLYPRLSFYLKNELRLDRERFGVLTDVRD